MKFLLPSEYQFKAAELFNQLRTKLVTELPFAQIEHVGSSAIKGALSKGDLDIFVGVPQSEFSGSLDKLKSMGFSIKEDTLQTAALCMLVSSTYDFDVAIQLVELGSEFESFLEFRDQLNSNPELVTQYNRLKEESSSLTPEQYRVKKSAFIKMILEKP